MYKSILLTLLLLLVASPALAQYESDTESVDAIITAVYESISGPAGQERDWDRFRNMFAPGAQLIPVAVRPDTVAAVYNSVDGYIERANPYFIQNGFFETEVTRTTEQYGQILHTFSTYESRSNADDPEPFARGINSFQLLNDGNRWWIINIFWVDEQSAGEPIPQKYLNK
ncbi:MAG: hypothetical protein AAF564_19265 [Bacteroidota bacterium]